MEWMILPLKRYAEFGGRSRRVEFWLFVLFSAIVGAVASLVDLLLGFESSTAGPVDGIANLALLVPSIAVTVRRLHDSDRSAWWLLLLLIPLLGWLALFIFFLLDGTNGENRFGPDPKKPHGEDLAEVFR